MALDAPLVAVAWQRFLRWQFDPPPSVLVSAVLALTVWGVYLADRWLDAKRGRLDADRHRFAARHPRAVAMAAALAFAAAAVGGWFLPREIPAAGVLVAAGVAAYLALVHVLGAGRDGLKELLVGVGFASGVAVPLMAAPVPAAAWLPSAVGFGLLCWLNCRLIDRWESATPVGPSDYLLAAAVAVVGVLTPARVAGALLVAVALLLAVHVGLAARPRVARVLADLVLLTPLAFGV